LGASSRLRQSHLVRGTALPAALRPAADGHLRRAVPRGSTRRPRLHRSIARSFARMLLAWRS